MIKAIAYNPETHVLVPREPSEEMLQAALRANMQHVIDCINDPAKSKDIGSEETCKQTYRSRYASMIAAAPQPEPNHNWCAGCSPDNCSGCGAAPAAYIFKPNNELLWPNEVDQNVFASDPEDYDLLYTTPQPDRVAELEAALKVARDGIDEFLVANDPTEFGCAGDLTLTAVECIKKLKAENECRLTLIHQIHELADHIERAAPSVTDSDMRKQMLEQREYALKVSAKWNMNGNPFSPQPNLNELEG